MSKINRKDEQYNLVESISPRIPVWAVFTESNKVCTAEVLFFNIYECKFEIQNPDTGDIEEKVASEIIPVVFGAGELSEVDDAENFRGLSLEKDPNPGAWVDKD